MNITTMINTNSVAEIAESIIMNAIIAAEKFNDERQNAFMRQRITFECSSKLNLFFSIEFLKSIKNGDELSCHALASRFEEECNDIDIACEMYYDQIKSNLTLMNALINYANSLDKLKKFYLCD